MLVQRVESLPPEELVVVAEALSRATTRLTRRTTTPGRVADQVVVDVLRLMSALEE